MRSLSLSSPAHLAGTAKPGWLDGLARRLVLDRLQRLEHGELRLRDGARLHRFGAGTGPAAEITVADPRFYRELAFGGSIGAGEAYLHGYYECDDLVGAVRLLLQNRAVLERLDGGAARLLAPLHWLYHRSNHNSRSGARRNIAAHYDLGNDFFAEWLDPTLMYSAAIFARPEMTLHEAQLARLETVCRKLQLDAQQHVLEIGSGWGSFAIYAAQQHGCRVTTTTISREQHQLASARVAAAGLAGRITLLQDDFRDLRGEFDRLVSLEMIEAIDYRLYPAFFRQCQRLLRADGALLLQAITIADQRFAAYRDSVDFIRRYVFPGGGLPSAAVLVATAAAHTDLRLLDLDDIGLHYATTLRCWRRNFLARLEPLRRRGYPEALLRLWQFYLGYCEGAFLERAISDVQMVFTRPQSRLQLA